MRTLKFYGQSDDLFEIDGTIGREPDEIGPGAVKVANDHAGLVVVADYAPDSIATGCWVIGIAPLDEDIPIPDWPMRFSTAGNGYSPVLEIDVPDGVHVSRVDASGDAA